MFLQFYNFYYVVNLVICISQVKTIPKLDRNTYISNSLFGIDQSFWINQNNNHDILGILGGFPTAQILRRMVRPC